MIRSIKILGDLLDGLAAGGLVIVAKLKSDNVASFGELLDPAMASRGEGNHHAVLEVGLATSWWCHQKTARTGQGAAAAYRCAPNTSGSR